MIISKHPRKLSSLPSADPPHPTRAGKFWQGIAHRKLLELLMKKGKENRIFLANLHCHVSPDGLEMTASFDAGIPSTKPPKETVFSLGILNSNSMLHRLTLMGGLRVKNNVGLALSEYPLGKHTTGLELEREIEEALRRFFGDAIRYQAAIDRLERRPLLLAEAERLLLQASREGIMPWSRTGQIDNQYREDPQTSLSLLYRFALVAQQNPPLKQMRQIYSFYRMLCENAAEAK